MKGIILAGGNGKRLAPITNITNKHLMPVGKKPMIYHPIERMVESGIDDIMIISGTTHMGSFFELLGSGKDLNCSLTYRVQDSPNGIGGALRLCKDFVGKDSCLVVLGDNIFDQNLKVHIENYKNNIKEGCMLFLRSVKDPHRYGVATFDKDNNLVKITEKPTNPDSNYCITGIYIYDNSVFDIIDTIKPSSRGEIEVTDINNAYIQTKKTNWCKFEGNWTDAGTWESYRLANKIFRCNDEK